MEIQPLSLSKMAVSHFNESIIIEEVMATHDPNSKDFKANFILNFVKNILYPTTTAGKAIVDDMESDEEESDDEEEPNEEESYNGEPKDVELSNQIKQLSFEIALKCSNNVDPHTTVIYFLKMLSTYSWESKLLIMLAAFSINFGEFSLVHGHKGLANKLTILKGRKTLVAPSHIQGSITQFLKSVLYLTKCIVKLAQSSSHNSSPIIPVACYWIITSVLTYASYFACLPSVDSEWLIVEGTQLSCLTAKVKDVISDCLPILAKKREEDSYKTLCHAFFDEKQIPSANWDVLKLLFNVKNGGKKKPIYDGLYREMVGLSSLKNKSLLLLISSNLDIDNYMLRLLYYFQWKTKLRVLWIPILDYPALWAIKNMEKLYRSLVNKGDFLSVRNLQKSIASGFARFVKEKFFPTFRIGGEPIIVSLDHHGRIVHRNAMHMVLMKAMDIVDRISIGVETGNSTIPLLENVLKKRTLAVRDLVPDIDRKIDEIAGQVDIILNNWLDGIQKQIRNPIYSNIYTSEREKELWKIETWCTKLVVGVCDPISNWVDDESKYIFFIGGNDLKWVKAFVSKVMSVIYLNPQLTIMMAYIGTNVKVASVINRDNVCEAPDDPYVSWFFWARLRSIFLSRIKFLDETHCDEECDEIVEGLKKLLAYEAKDLAVDRWAMLCNGNKIVVHDLGDKMLTVMNEHEKWKKSAIAKGFDQAFKDHHKMLDSTYTSQHHPCCALEYPYNFDKVPKNVKCPQCCRKMQKFVTFMCCHGKN